jgi:hypothetical protein
MVPVFHILGVRRTLCAAAREGAACYLGGRLC